MKITTEEKVKIYRQAKHRLGAPIRKIELDDEQLDSLLEIATEDYVEYIQNYITEHQWPTLIGVNVNEADLISYSQVKKILKYRNLDNENNYK